MKKLFSLFLSQSYQDCWDDYSRSIKSTSFPRWDYIIFTASNERQAEGFREQLEERKGFLPVHTKFAVIPDRDGKRIGSGGATLSVLKYIYEQEKTFSGLRILVIHSGGDSKRVPQYSSLGKLFSPVPHQLPNGRNATLFDEFLISMSSVPARIREGMVILSGDVLLLFNPLQIDYNGRDAAAISFKEDVETGKNHGVFLGNTNGNVRSFLHKQSVQKLKEVGAVNESNCVDIDTGAVIFSNRILEALYSLVSTEEDYDRYVNETVRLSLYGDFLYPLAEESTIEQFYKEKPEGDYCDELLMARKKVWEILRPYRLKLLRLAPAKFIHFGTTREILELMSGGVVEYKNLGWDYQIGSSMKKNSCAGYNSVLSSTASVGEKCYLEVCSVHSGAKLGNNVVLSYLNVHDEVIPDNVVLHGLKQKNGKFVVRIYGVNDNPKENQLFGKDLEKFGERIHVDLWQGQAHSLWTANLYPEKDSIREAVAAALELYNMVQNEGENSNWPNANYKSLCSGFNDADSKAIIEWNKHMQSLVQMDEIVKAIRNKIPANELRKLSGLTDIQKEWLEKKELELDFSSKIRLHYYLGKVLDSDSEIQNCFKEIERTILGATLQHLKYNEELKIATERYTVELPLRVNWGGGWSDTPPYCNECGGTVLNMAILLNGEKPVEVTVERIPEYKIVFDSRDMDVHGEFEEIEPLQRTGDPFDSFALQKACLLACGVIPQKGHNFT